MPLWGMVHTFTSPEFVTATTFSADDNYDNDYDDFGGDGDGDDGYSFAKKHSHMLINVRN